MCASLFAVRNISRTVGILYSEQGKRQIQQPDGTHKQKVPAAQVEGALFVLVVVITGGAVIVLFGIAAVKQRHNQELQPVKTDAVQDCNKADAQQHNRIGKVGIGERGDGQVYHAQDDDAHKHRFEIIAPGEAVQVVHTADEQRADREQRQQDDEVEQGFRREDVIFNFGERVAHVIGGAQKTRRQDIAAFELNDDRQHAVDEQERPELETRRAAAQGEGLFPAVEPDAQKVVGRQNRLAGAFGGF